jgi:hypothetical protein
MFGNHLGTISLCGTVAEMVAILLHDTSEITVNEGRMTLRNLNKPFGKSFEDLRQSERVQILHTQNVINDAEKAAFDLIRTTRNKYMHVWSKDDDTLTTDAVKVFKAAVSLVVSAIGQEFDDGRFILSPRLARYLEKTGAFDAPERDQGTE